jgi:acetate kinase
MRVLVVNAGSSSLKLSMLHDDRLIDSTSVPAGADGWAPEELARFCDGIEVDAVGHRVVHGGEMYDAPVLVDAAVRRTLEDLTGLAPLHQPKSLAGMDAVTELLPGVPAVASFDTAFHATMPAAATTYALPRDWRERWGLRRFGFHGLSHAYASRRVAELIGSTKLKVVICHLGAGASLCAVRNGASVDTTMGFTPLEGLVMATRSGSVDPGLLLWLLERTDLSESELAEALEHRSGLLGLSGTGDMAELVQRAATGDDVASLALDVYAHRVGTGIGAMAASMAGIDALVFTGGVGERSATVREQVCAGLDFLGVDIDRDRRAPGSADAEIGLTDARVRTFVIAAREDLEVARGVRELLQ